MLPILGIVLVPGILWGWIFYHAQRYKKIYLPLLLMLFIAGMSCGFLALILNHAIEKFTLFWPDASIPEIDLFGRSISLFGSGFWFLVGVNEEFSKLLVLLAVVYPSRHLEEKFDGILYAVVVSVGFATMENFFYLEQFGLAVVTTRSVVTIPAHAFMSVPMGYYVAKSRIQLDNIKVNKNKYFPPIISVLQGWLISAFLHGLYDFLLSIKLGSEAYLQIIIMGIISFFLGRSSLKDSKIKSRN